MSTSELTANERADARPSTFRRLAGDSVIYGGADLVSKAIAFITFPLIAAALSPLAFGALELLMTAVALIGIFASCGLNNAVQRFYWDPDTPASQRPTLVSSGLAALGFFLAFSLALGVAVTAALSGWLPTWDVPMTWIAPAAALVLMVGNQVGQYLLDAVRVHLKPWRFFGVSLVTRVASAIGGVIAVVWLGMGLDGLLALQATVSLFALPLAALAVRKDLTTAIDSDVIRKLLRFGHPFIYMGLAFWLFGSIDRWLLAAMSSVEEVGIYSVAHRFASIVMVASYAFGQAWAPLALKSRVDEPQSYRRMYADVLLVLACGMLVLGGSIAIFSRELIGLLMPAEYGAAARPLAILCFGVILQSTTQVTAIGISLDNKTALFARLSWITAGVNLVLNLLLIPRLGATGAALATSLSYLFLTSCYLYFTQRLHPLPVPWRRVIAWLVLLIGIGTLTGQSAMEPGYLSSIHVKALLLVVCMCICLVLVVWRRSARVGC